ncbi:MAG: diguanylate cyclase domain-containing protein [Myxococcaceae bacterium]
MTLASMRRPSFDEKAGNDWERHKAVVEVTPRLSIALGAASFLLLCAHLFALRMRGASSGLAEAVGLLLVIAESAAVFICVRALRSDLPQPRPIVVTLALTSAAAGAGTAVALGGLTGLFPFGLLPAVFAWPLLVPDRAKETAIPVVGGLLVHLIILALNNSGPNAVPFWGGTVSVLMMGAVLSLATAEVLDSWRRQVAELTQGDPVTGVLKDRTLRRKLDELTARRLRTPSQFSVALLDIDRFKSINDTYGRAAGDKVLEMLSAAVMAEIRKTDFVGRMRSDEFIVVLDACDSENAKGLVERVRSRLNEAAAVRGGPVRVTFSAGIAAAPVGEKWGADQVLAAAHGALETSKEMARNCTSIAPAVYSSSVAAELSAIVDDLEPIADGEEPVILGRDLERTGRAELVTELIQIPADLPVLSLPIPASRPPALPPSSTAKSAKNDSPERESEVG